MKQNASWKDYFLRQSRNGPHSMEHGGSLSHLWKYPTCHWARSTNSIPYSQVSYLRPSYHLDLPRNLFPTDFTTNSSAPLLPHTCHIQLASYSYCEYSSWSSSLLNFIQSRLTYTLSGPNAFHHRWSHIPFSQRERPKMTPTQSSLNINVAELNLFSNTVILTEPWQINMIQWIQHSENPKHEIRPYFSLR
jgi:hypothetical protein